VWTHGKLSLRRIVEHFIYEVFAIHKCIPPNAFIGEYRHKLTRAKKKIPQKNFNIEKKIFFLIFFLSKNIHGIYNFSILFISKLLDLSRLLCRLALLSLATEHKMSFSETLLLIIMCIWCAIMDITAAIYVKMAVFLEPYISCETLYYMNIDPSCKKKGRFKSEARLADGATNQNETEPK
jgi:hypothetical protein